MPTDSDNAPQTIASVNTLPPAEIPPAAWRLRDLVLFLVFAALALMFSSFVAFAGYAILKPLAGWMTSTRDLANNTFFNVTTQLIFYLFLLGFISLLVKAGYHLPFWRGLSWRKLSPGGVFWLVLGGIVLGFGVQFVPRLLPDSDKFPLEQMFSSPAAAYTVALFAVLIAPFMEELVFRGVLFAFFENLVGMRFAIAGTALLFAGLHVPEYWRAWNHVLLILLVGFAFSLVRGVSGSLTASFVLHLSYNGSQMLGLFVASNHFRQIQGALLAWQPMALQVLHSMR